MLYTRYVLILLLFLLPACSTEEPTVSSIETATVAVAAAATDLVPSPTATSLPPSATPTDVPPTQTPRPTWTVIPTNTPLSVPTAELAAATLVPTLVPTVEVVATGVVSEEVVVVSSAENTPTPHLQATAIPPTPIPPTRQPTSAATAIPPTNAPPPSATPLSTATPTPQPTAAPATATVVPTSPPPTAVPPTAEPEVSTTRIGDIGSLPLDTEVTIVGSVVWSASFSNGFKLTLDDGSGRVTLLMWHNVYDECWDKNILNVGATVSATGNTGSFEGELQVTPWWGGGVDVIAPAYLYAAPRAVNELGQFIGQRAMIEGDVSRVDIGENFTKIYVNDGTGEVEVFFWNNVWVRVPNKDAITAGRRVKAVGVVGEFRGTIQLAPPLPVDIILQ